MSDVPWLSRVDAAYEVGNLTRLYRNVMHALCKFRGSGGRIFPSHAALAARAKCSIRTVSRALAQARELGLVMWMPRRRRGSDWRRVQDSNLYVLLTPPDDRAAAPGKRPIWPRRSTAGQQRQATSKESKKEAREALHAMLSEGARAPDLLARRRAQVPAMLQQQREDRLRGQGWR